METRYSPSEIEKKWYDFWESHGYFKPNRPNADPYTIILPPPNANAALHLGHAMYVVEDILIRYHRMLGFNTLWLPGADHAGFETQVVFEKNLNKEGKSRFDFDRNSLYDLVFAFVQQNKSTMEDQLRRLGFSLDWSREKFTLEPDVVKTVYDTFFQLHQDNLVYRGSRMVNYCTKDGTSFSDLEVNYDERQDPLYYIKYKNADTEIVVATVRPETIFGDVAIAVHPEDTRYLDLVGKDITFDGLLGPVTLKIIADNHVDPQFGTGAVKVTPAHDPNDYDMAMRHNLPFKQVIGFNGRLNDLTGKYAGLKVAAARQQVAEDLEKAGLIDHIDTDYTHSVGICYKCKNVIEPMVMPNWFVKTNTLAKRAADKISDGTITIIPNKPYTKLALDWLENIIDWNISRQIVFGIRIPAWYCADCTDLTITFLPTSGEKPVTGQISELLKEYSFDQIAEGLQTLTAPSDASYQISAEQPKECPNCHNRHLLQETDVFDTWFSSSQWPFATLGYPNAEDFKTFYPTSVMETGADILRFWVCRMIMMGLYRTNDIPFKDVYLHGLVVDKNGQKMSKSKGNVVNPLEQLDKFGADALRMALIFGGAAGSNIAYSEDKTRGMRNFATKLWNISRFILLNLEKLDGQPQRAKLNADDQSILNDLHQLVTSTTNHLNRYRLSDATQEIYDFIWHNLADIYVEQTKERLNGDDMAAKATALSVLLEVLTTSLTLLHPFMPFVTEEIWSQLPQEQTQGQPLIISPWPTEK